MSITGANIHSQQGFLYWKCHNQNCGGISEELSLKVKKFQETRMSYAEAFIEAWSIKENGDSALHRVHSVVPNKIIFIQLNMREDSVIGYWVINWNCAYLG